MSSERTRRAAAAAASSSTHGKAQRALLQSVGVARLRELVVCELCPAVTLLLSGVRTHFSNLNPGQDTREQATKRTHERRHESTQEGTHQRKTNQPTNQSLTRSAPELVGRVRTHTKSQPRTSGRGHARTRLTPLSSFYAIAPPQGSGAHDTRRAPCYAKRMRSCASYVSVRCGGWLDRSQSAQLYAIHVHSAASDQYPSAGVGSAPSVLISVSLPKAGKTFLTLEMGQSP